MTNGGDNFGDGKGEFALISRLASLLGDSSAPGVIGIGDDCAGIPKGDGFLLMACDIAVEGRHFRREWASLEDVGWKVASANVSDVVACGGKPTFALVSLGIPQDTPETELEALYRGLAEAGRHYDFQVIGGNVSGAQELIVDVFILGETERFIPRGGAQPGDLLAVSGTLGDSDAGLTILQMEQPGSDMHPLVRQHLHPTARVDLVPLLQEVATAAIDISDGLAAELHHLAAASGVRLDVERTRIPLSKALSQFAAERGEQPLQRALGGGESYQILFTLPAASRQRIEGSDITVIGEVSSGEGVYLSGSPLPPSGWDHLQEH